MFPAIDPQPLLRAAIAVACIAASLLPATARAWDWELVDDHVEARIVAPNRQPNGDLAIASDVQLTSADESFYRETWNGATAAVYAEGFQNVAIGGINPPPLQIPTTDFGLDSATSNSRAILLDANDNVISVVVDFAELATINVAFDQTAIRSRTASRDMRIVRTLTFRSVEAGEDEPASSTVTASYGARFFDLMDSFAWDGRGGILGRSTVETETLTSALGPHAAIRWNRTNGPWRFFAESSATLGFIHSEALHSSATGEHLAPGQPNSPLYYEPTYGRFETDRSTFAPLMEAQIGASRTLSANTSLGVAWSAFHLPDMQAANQSVVFELSALGLDGSASRDVFQHTLMFTLEHRR